MFGNRGLEMKPSTITLYGGIGETGGNKILLEDGETKILLGFGISFAVKDQYYSFPLLSPRNEWELLDLGFLPVLKGAYRFDNTEPTRNSSVGS